MLTIQIVCLMTNTIVPHTARHRLVHDKKGHVVTLCIDRAGHVMTLCIDRVT